MSQLSSLFSDFPELEKEIKLDVLGVARVSIHGAARLLGVPRATLGDHLGIYNSSRKMLSYLDKTLTEKGFYLAARKQWGEEGGIPDVAFSVLLDCYSRLDNASVMLKAMQLAITAIGVRSQSGLKVFLIIINETFFRKTAGNSR